MERVKLEVHPRAETGSRAVRRLRKRGLIPGVLYGAGKPAVTLAVDERALRAAVSTDSGLHAVLDLTLEGQKKEHVAIVKDYQLDPVRHVVTHVDFQEVRLDQPIEADVTVVLEGVPEGVTMGGILDLVTRTVTVSALPTEMPERITLNVEGLTIGDVNHVSDLTAPENVTILDDPEEVICSVQAPRIVEVEEEEELEEGEEGVEAEAGEPEVVGEKGEEAADESE